MPDTTPGKPGTRRTTPPAEPAPAAEPVTTESEQVPEPTPEPDTSGWYRNRGPVVLTVQPAAYPSARLKPGDATWLPEDPRNPALEPCGAPPPEPAADDTARSEQ